MNEGTEPVAGAGPPGAVPKATLAGRAAVLFAGRRPERRVLIVRCHPVDESFVGTLADRVEAAAASVGHEVRVIDLYREGFDPVLGLAGWQHHLDPPDTKPEIEAHVGLLRWCNTLVFVYPTWFGGQPAMLKGWFDRVLVAGVAFDLRPGTRRVRPRLRNVRRIVVVTTHGSSKLVNAAQGEPGKRVILRGLRSMCHPRTRGTWVAMYGNDRCDQTRRADFLNRVETHILRL